MKLNFWQWLGIVLLAVGLIFMFTKKTSTDDVVTQPGVTPATQPATSPTPL